MAVGAPGGFLVAVGLYVAFGSVETDAPASQHCTGSAALQWTRTSLEPCRTDSFDQFLGGLMIITVGAALVAWAVSLERRRRRPTSPPIDPSRAAWANPETVRSLRALRRRAAIVGVPGLVAIVAFVWLASWLGERAEQFAATAERTTGIVETDVGFWRDFHDAIEVVYEVDGVPRRATVYLNDSSPAYDDDDEVTVLYDAADPARATIDGEENDPPTLVWPMIVALIGGVVGLGTGAVWMVRYRRWRRAARSTAWRPTHIGRYTKEARTPIHLAVVESSPPLRLHTTSSAWDVLDRFDPDGRVLVWVAGQPDDDDGVAIAAAGGRVIAGARRSRSRRRTRRWSEEVATADEEDAEDRQQDPRH